MVINQKKNNIVGIWKWYEMWMSMSINRVLWEHNYIYLSAYGCFWTSEEAKLPEKPKIYTIWPLQKKFVNAYLSSLWPKFQDAFSRQAPTSLISPPRAVVEIKLGSMCKVPKMASVSRSVFKSVFTLLSLGSFPPCLSLRSMFPKISSAFYPSLFTLSCIAHFLS